MKEKILIINKSKTLSEYLRQKLSLYDFDVIIARDGFDGQIKMKNETPDLVILDYYLTKIGIIDFLKEKDEYKKTRDIPVIMTYSKTDKLDKETIIKLVKYKVNKILPKPVEIDLLFKAIGELLKINFILDSSPCIIDINIKDDILFIEVLKGLNQEKIELAKKRIEDMIELYNININNILISCSDVKKQINITDMLDLLIKSVLSSTKVLISGVHFLTKNKLIKEYLSSHPKYKFIEIADNLNDLLMEFSMTDKNKYEAKVKDAVQSLLSSSSADQKENELSHNFSYYSEKERNHEVSKEKNIAVIDDDLCVLEYMEAVLSREDWNTHLFDNGKLFVEALMSKKFDLLIMDLVMPDINGLKLLEYLRLKKLDIPVIIYSALKNKEHIYEATRRGIESYLIKPMKPEAIIAKIKEVFDRNIIVEKAGSVDSNETQNDFHY